MDRVHGVNVAFWVASGIAFAGLVLAFFLKPYRKRSSALGEGVEEPAAEPSPSPAAGAGPEPQPASTASAERSASALE
jgi:hypothetical protein